MNQPKICIDCAHFVADRECKHPSLGIDLVNGKPRLEWAAVMRLNHNKCKTEGLLFEPMEAVIYDLKDLFPAPQFPNIRGETQ